MKLICFITQIERFHFLFGGLFVGGLLERKRGVSLNLLEGLTGDK